MKYLICPLCATSLLVTLQGVGCGNGHQFDRAKEGYFNLLPVQHKNSRDPGDAKQQLEARRDFLNAGFFLPLLQTLKQLLPVDTKTLLDIGCGEGYFTQAMSEHCNIATVYGIDIAKVGVRLAAKRGQGNLTYAVASSYALPIATGSMDVVTRIYAPSKDEELQRILSPQGKCIVVTPGEDHLLSLRQKIYQQLRPHPQPQTPTGFSDFAYQRLRFTLDIPAGKYTHALLQMTPFAWRLTPTMLSQLIDEGLQDVADFQVSVYQLTSASSAV